MQWQREGGAGPQLRILVGSSGPASSRVRVQRLCGWISSISRVREGVFMLKNILRCFRAGFVCFSKDIHVFSNVFSNVFGTCFANVTLDY